MRMRIQISNLSKSYDARPVLRDINLSIASGEFVAVVGASGSGKSTLLRMLAGLRNPEAGGVLRDGKRVPGLNRDARIMFQDARLLPWRRVIDNVRLGLARSEHDRAVDALRKIGRAGSDTELPG